MSIAFDTGFANNLNDTQSRKAAMQKTTALPFRDYLTPTTDTTPQKINFDTGSVSGKTAEFDSFSDVRSCHVSETNGFAQAMEQMLGIAPGSINTGVSDTQHNSLESKAAVVKQIA